MSEAPAPERVSAAPPAPPKRAPELPDPWPVPSNQEIKREASPFGDPDWRVRLYSWCGFVLRLLVIAATVVTAMQYFAAREEKRVERALDLVTLWEQPPYQEAQKALDARLAPLRREAGAMLGDTPDRTDLEVVSKRIGLAAMKEGGGAQPLPDFQEQFGRILYFLNRLAFCVEGNLCSRAVADAYFRDYAESFWLYFSGYILDQRRTSPNYGRPLDSYLHAAPRGFFDFLPALPATPSDAGGAD